MREECLVAFVGHKSGCPGYLNAAPCSFGLGSKEAGGFNSEIANTQFANSYGKPFVGEYIPDYKSCGLATEWTSVTLHYQGNISGRQFDRLGGVWLS